MLNCALYRTFTQKKILVTLLTQMIKKALHCLYDKEVPHYTWLCKGIGILHHVLKTMFTSMAANLG